MKALTVVPGKADSLTLEHRDEPDPGDDLLLVDGLAVGVCGTDREIAGAEYGWAPPGRESLVIGHESLGRVRAARPGSGFEPGDLVAGVVRRPDPAPCGACARGQFDSCRNGDYTERGIKELDGYAAQTWTVEPDYAVRIDPGLAETGVLMEPASVVAKAWDQVDAVGNRGWYEPRTALVTGAGPIGLLAALIGVQRGLEVHVLDIVADGPKPELVAGLGAAYHHRGIDEVLEHTAPDIVIEATGVSRLVFEAMAATGRFGVVCLTGVSPVGRKITVDVGAVGREMVLENDAVIGSVNAGLGHYAQAADVLAAADRDWLAGLITRRVPLEDYREAFEPGPDDVKVVIDLRR
ncbi:glucose 1-dehydrogenase [Glycomyces salinus]|uniref:glucose 1-dehydrogenase n=1 Tax=Glycomyces salinus TaxID=980294 RepID=UPI0018EB5A6B|nr:glucose 1-dehydrogenase [Glycomyces salinus]